MGSAKIAIISTDVMGPVRNGGVGTSCAHLSELLANDGYEVDLVFASAAPIAPKWKRLYAQKNVNLKTFGDLEFELQCSGHWATLSYYTYSYLYKNHYDLVIFPDMGGLGYFSQIAKRGGIAFQNTNFLIMFLGPLSWSKKENEDSIRSISELSIPMLEKYSVENADLVQLATDWSKSWCQEQGWKLPNSKLALFPFSLPRARTKKKSNHMNFNEIVFFGRIEPRKGIRDFLKAIVLLNEDGNLKGIKITLLGSLGDVDGLDIAKTLAEYEQESGIKLNVKDSLQSGEAIQYLQTGKRLAVIPSHSETMGYTVVECLANEIPFIASDIEPFRDLIGPNQSRLLFRANDPSSLASTLLHSLKSGQGILDRPRAERLHQETVANWRKLIKAGLSRTEGASSTSGATSKCDSGKDAVSISVLVAHHNRAAYLNETLYSLLNQTIHPYEVIVYDDASTDKAFLNVIEKLSTLFAAKGIQLRLIRGSINRGPSYARNQLAAAATGQFFLFMDDDNLAHANEIEVLLRMQSRLNADVITIAMKKFIDGQEHLWQERRWTPVGFDLSCALFDNTFGDTNFLMRSEIFRSVGGFIDDPRITAEDMNILVKAALKGARMFVCPEPLFSYRIHPNNRSRVRARNERYFHISELFKHLTEMAGVGSLEPLAQLLNSWNRRLGHAWVEEPSFWPKRLNPKLTKRDSRLESLPRLTKSKCEKFGCSRQVSLGRNSRLFLDLNSAIANPESGDFSVFIDVNFVAEKPGVLRSSNQAVRMPFEPGHNRLRIPVLPNSEDGQWLSFEPLKRVFLTRFDLVRESQRKPATDSRRKIRQEARHL